MTQGYKNWERMLSNYSQRVGSLILYRSQWIKAAR